MCTINGTCGCNSSTGSFLLALTGRALWELVKLLAKGVQLLLVALIGAAIVLAPPTWRLTKRAVRAGHARWRARTRAAVLDRQPVAALPDKPTDKLTAMTLADLHLKEPANS